MKHCCTDCKDGLACSSWRARLHRFACKVFAAAEEMGYTRLVYPDAPLVRALDAVAGSKCKYCMAVRVGLIGAGLALFNWVGVVLVAIAVGCTVLERRCK